MRLQEPMNSLMDLEGRFHGDALSQDLRQPRRSGWWELGVVKGREPRGIGIAGSEMNLDTIGSQNK